VTAPNPSPVAPPTPQAGHHVARQHLAAVVVQQPVTQRQSPGFGPVIDGMARQHLRPCVTISVEREQRIKHHHHVVPGDEGADQRVEQRKIGIWDEFQGGGGGGARDPGPGQARGANYSGSVAEKLASFHPTFPIRPATHIGHSQVTVGSDLFLWTIDAGRPSPQCSGSIEGPPGTL